MGLSQELLAKKEKLCAEHYPKCITTECPLAKLFCYDIANFNNCKQSSCAQAEDNADFKGGRVDGGIELI